MVDKGREPFVGYIAEVGSVRQGDPIAHVVNISNKRLDKVVEECYNTHIDK